MLSQEELKSRLHYDPRTGIFTWIKMSAKNQLKIGDIAGSVKVNKTSGKKYRHIKINGKLYKAHRLAFIWMAGKLPAEEVDHADGDGLNNIWENLSQATHQENCKNHRLRKDSTSGFVGVCWHIRDNNWSAYISIDGKRKYLGYFGDKSEAIAARQAASIEHGYHVNHGQVRPL